MVFAIPLQIAIMMKS